MTNRTSTIRCRAGFFAFAVAALITLPATFSLAADATERPYDPPVGSRWVIESETTTDELRADGQLRNSLVKSRAELIIEAKTADGFRIAYANRGVTAEGNSPTLPLMRSAVQALQDVTIRAATDRAGKPVRVDNLDEAKAALRNAVGRLTAPFEDKPQLQAVLNQMMAGLIEVDAAGAAASYLEELPELAKSQNTGMKLHDIRRSSRTFDNPLGTGGALKSSDAFELTEVDAVTGKRVFVSTTSYDMDSMKDFMQSVSKKLMATAGNSVKPEQIDSIVKAMVLSLDERTVFEVVDGMTTRIVEKSVTTASAMGHNMRKTKTRSPR
jgi:hypothetical protein